MSNNIFSSKTVNINYQENILISENTPEKNREERNNHNFVNPQDNFELDENNKNIDSENIPHKKLELKDLGFFQKLKKARKIQRELEESTKTEDLEKKDKINTESDYCQNSTKDTKPNENPNNIQINNTIKPEETKENLKETINRDRINQREEEEPPEAVNKNNFFSSLRTMMNQVATTENEKYENKIFYGFLYPMLDYFDNMKFNMDRLKSLDYLCEQKKFNFSFKNFKQLGKEEKKNLLADLSDAKAKYQEEKMEKIKELKNEGKKFNLIKITNLNTFEKYLVNSESVSEWEISQVKECFENNWEFPPLNYYENISTLLKNEEKNKNSDGNNISDHDINKLETQSVIKSPERLDVSVVSDDLILRKSKTFNEQEKDIKSIFNSIYSLLIDNNFEKYWIKKPVLKRQERGIWIDTKNYFCLFDNFVFLYNPNNYRYKICIDNLWKNYEKDIYNHDDSKTVFYINTHVKFNLEYINKNQENNLENLKESEINNEEINDIDESKFYNESNNIFDPKNLFSILICFMSNINKYNENYKDIDEKKTNYLKEYFYESYISFDLLVKNHVGNYEILEENLNLYSFYDVKKINYIEQNKEYILIFKAGLIPVGYTLNIYSDCFIDALSLEKYLESYQNFKINKFPIKHASIEAKKQFLLCKYSIKVKYNKQIFY